MSMNRKAKAALKKYHEFIAKAMKRGLTHKQAIAAWHKHHKPAAAKKPAKKGARKGKRGAKRAAKRSAKKGTRKAPKRGAKKSAKKGGKSVHHHRKTIIQRFHAYLKDYAHKIGFSKAEAAAWSREVMAEVKTNIEAAARHAADKKAHLAEAQMQRAAALARANAARRQAAREAHLGGGI